MGFDDRPRDLAERLYRWALVVYPAVFRRQYGPDMVEMFRDARRARVRTGSSALGLWAKTMRDLVANAAMMRLASWRKPLTPTNTVLATLSTTGFHSTRSRLMGSLIQDGRFALRTLWKNRGFTAVAVATIALGIGANSAIFTVVNAVLLRPLAYPAPERLVVMWTQLPQDNQFTFPVSQAEYYDYREESELFQDMGAYFGNVVTVTGEGDAQRVAATGASASLLQILGLRAAVGRLYRAEEDRANTNPIVVLGHDFWTRQFGADPAVVGRQITVNGGEFGVIGVMAAGMDVPNGATDLWFPLGIDRSQITDRSGHFLTVIGRLAPNGNLVQARAEMDATLGRWEEVYAGQHTTDPLVHPMTLVALDDQLFGGVRPAMFRAFTSAPVLSRVRRISGELSRSAQGSRWRGVS